MRATQLITWLYFLAGWLVVLPAGMGPNPLPVTAAPPAARSIDRALDVIPFALAYLTLPEENIPTPSGSMTIEAWVKPDQNLGCFTVYGNNSLNGVWLAVCSSVNGIRFSRYGMASNQFVDGARPIAAGRWWHIAAVYDAATAKSTLFVDGIQDGEPKEQEMPPGWTLPPGNAYIGRDAYGYQFEGLIDEVRIWNVARTGEQIRADMYREFIAPRPGLVGEWPLQGDGSDVAGSHHGKIDVPIFSLDSPLPIQVAAPSAVSRMALDGACDPDREYAGAPLVSMGTAQVYPIKTGTDLWLCLRSISEGPDGASGYRVDVFLDPQHAHGRTPTSAQLRLSLWRDGSRAAARGGSAGFTPAAGLDAQWDAAFQPAGEGATGGTMEFRISSRLLSGWDRSIGLALREDWALEGAPAVDVAAWPFFATGTEPDTWGDLTLPPMQIDLPLVTR
jgi:hypothetical protein